MKILLSALAGLALTASAAPLITNNPISNKNVTVGNQNLDFFSSKIVKPDNQTGITENDDVWVINNFSLNFRPTKLTFAGDLGATVYVRWGNNVKNLSWKTLDVTANGQWKTLWDKDYFDGFARQTIRLRYFVENTSGNMYKLNFYFFTKSYNSFSTSWGKLDISNSLQFSN